MSKVKVAFDKKNVMKQISETAYKHLSEKVEANYCIQHSQFARFAVVDQESMQWKIEGCCEALITKAANSVRQQS